MRTAADVISKLGGSTVVAALLGLPMTTVASWKNRESIPAQHWLALSRIAKEKRIAGITLESLAKLAEPAPQKAAS